VPATHTATQVKRELAELADTERAKTLAWFFKTGKGEYADGDRFLGITVPQQRKVAARYRHLPLPHIATLLRSPSHEHRFVALAILVLQFAAGKDDLQRQIFDFYLANTAAINNWDLVDSSSRYILGQYLLDKPRDVLYALAQSENLWERRIAIISTLAFLKVGQLDDAFRISEILLEDKHDLIHKAVGWVLREAGTISRTRQLRFLADHYARVPRTALRYAIEHLTEPERKQILAGQFTSVIRQHEKKTRRSKSAGGSRDSDDEVAN
jgi:3-methyladenine DNA glycosylase AlkD